MSPARQTPTRCCAPRPRRRRAWLEDHATICKALGDVTRLAMVDLLARAEGPLCVCDIESCFELSQPTISHHLGLLRKAGLVEAERRGTWMYYRLAPARIRQFRAFVSELAERDA
jgi:ArsR family transcriptional regulator